LDFGLGTIAPTIAPTKAPTNAPSNAPTNVRCRFAVGALIDRNNLLVFKDIVHFILLLKFNLVKCTISLKRADCFGRGGHPANKATSDISWCHRWCISWCISWCHSWCNSAPVQNPNYLFASNEVIKTSSFLWMSSGCREVQKALSEGIRNCTPWKPFGIKQRGLGANEAVFEHKSQIDSRPGWKIGKASKECCRSVIGTVEV